MLLLSILRNLSLIVECSFVFRNTEKHIHRGLASRSLLSCPAHSVVHANNPGTPRAKAGGSQVPGQPGQLSNLLTSSQNKAIKHRWGSQLSARGLGSLLPEKKEKMKIAHDEDHWRARSRSSCTHQLGLARTSVPTFPQGSLLPTWARVEWLARHHPCLGQGQSQMDGETLPQRPGRRPGDKRGGDIHDAAGSPVRSWYLMAPVISRAGWSVG